MKSDTPAARAWTGSFARLESQLNARLCELKDSDPLAPVWVLVGSNYVGMYLRRRLALSRPLVNTRFVTMIDLVRLLAGTSAVAADHLQERLAARTAVSATAADGGADGDMARALNTSGFAGAALATCKDLWEAGAVEGIAGLFHEAGLRSSKLDTLTAIDDRLRRLLDDAHLVTTPSLFITAERNASELPSILGTDRLFVYGFYDLQERQRRLLASCASHVTLEFFVPYQPEPAFRYSQLHWPWLKSVGATVEVVGDDVDWPLFSGHLGRLPRPERTPRVSIFSAPGITSEVEELARRVLRQAEQGTPFYKVAVLARSLETYGPVIGEVFERAGIPHYTAGGEELARVPAGRALVDFARLAFGSMERAEWLEWLAQAPLDLEALGVLPGDDGLWDSITIEAGIVAGEAEWLSALRRQAGVYRQAAKRATGDPERVWEVREATRRLDTTRRLMVVMRRLFAWCSEVRRALTWKALAGALDCVVGAFGEGETRVKLELALDSLGELDTVAPPSDEQTVTQLVERAVVAQRLRTGAFQRGTVTVMDVMQARGLRFAIIYLVGMAEHVFPVQARQDPLLLDRERGLLNASLGGEPGPLSVSSLRGSEEEFLFALTIQAAEEELVLSFPRADSSGRQRLPSQFLLRFAAELEGKRLTYQSLQRLPRFHRVALTRPARGAFAVPIDTREWDLTYLVRARDRGDVDAILSLAGLVGSLGRSLLLREAQWGHRELTTYDGLLDEPELREALAAGHGLARRRFSASRIETYAKCPYSYYLRNVLGVRKTDEPQEIAELSALDRGTLYHAVLEHFYSAEKKAGRLPLRPGQLDEHLAGLERAARQVFRKTEALTNVGHALMWELQKQTVLDELKRFLKRESLREEGWYPVAFEVEFGLSNPVELPGAGVSFVGRIDRLDVTRGRDRARVTDYKSGKLSYYRDNSLMGGETIQLPVYILAASSHLGLPPGAVTARYASVSERGGFGEVLFDGTGWEQTAAELNRVVAVVDQGIQSGRFFAYPGGQCRNCDYALVCPTAVATLAERKSGDSALSDFVQLKEGS